MFADTSLTDIDLAMQKAWTAFEEYRQVSIRERARFMRAIAKALEEADDSLIATAMRETNLAEARLKNEKGRTVFQLNSYADACERGEWLQVRIDTANNARNPPRPDIRKMMVPLGPAVVFGSSNFPFAFSTAGGDTACCFAAGCSVIVKAHPAHAETSTLVAGIISRVVAETGMPENVFSHVYGASFEVGEALVKHPFTKVVSFTGSYAGGKQLFDWGNQRKEPIPVFAEMGSINPIFLLPEKCNTSVEEVAKMFTASLTLGVGQFCTNPGLLIGVSGADLDKFIAVAGEELSKQSPASMLHTGIAKAFRQNSGNALAQQDVQLITTTPEPDNEICGAGTLATVKAETFLSNPVLHQEVFGPYSLIVQCSDPEEMMSIAQKLEGQLTCTIMATEEELMRHRQLVDYIRNICGRLLFNNVPTGVEVCLSMQHGGPFPATSDARFTSVGADGILRFVRPVAFQNWPGRLLPDELKNDNPLNIFRTVDNLITKEKVPGAL